MCEVLLLLIITKILKLFQITNIYILWTINSTSNKKMLETRDKIVSQVGELNKIKFSQPSAMQLHGSRPLMDRVERQQQRVYQQKISQQQKDLQLNLARIDKYNADLQAEEKRRLGLLTAYDSSKELLPLPIFQPIGLVVQKPVIGIPCMPFQGRTRLHSRTMAKGLKRLR